MSYFSLVMSFVEESAIAFAMEKSDTLKLRLACEEVFAYLAESDQKGTAITIETVNGSYYVGVRFIFEARFFEPRAFNLTTKPSLESDSGLREMGLIIASRSVDRLYMLHNAREGFGVGLLKEKTYPEMRELVAVPVKPLNRYDIITPDSETLKLFVRHAAARYPARLFPADFIYPGKIADMVASGRYHALVASDNQVDAAGGIMWRAVGARMIECFGPYLFNQPPECGMAEGLVDRLLMTLAKTDTVCLLDLYATPELPKEYFELLGTIDYALPDGTRQPWPFYYRHLKEDPGSQVWAHPDLRIFLNDEYRRLSFAREIVLTSHGGEERPPHSVLSPSFDRPQGLVRLRAVWDGVDFGDILEAHVRALRGEGYSNIFFEIDCAHAWQANLASVLIENCFMPRLVLPYAGKADLILFQYTGDM